MYRMTIHQLPEPGDVLTPQYFDDKTEIRANMTGMTGTGTLIAEGRSVPADLTGDSWQREIDLMAKEVEATLGKLIAITKIGRDDKAV